MYFQHGKKKINKKIKQKLTKNTHYTNWCVASCGGKRRGVGSIARWCELKTLRFPPQLAKGRRKHCQMVRIEALQTFDKLKRCKRSASWNVTNVWRANYRQAEALRSVPTATRQAWSAATAEIRWSGCEVLSEGKRESGKGRKIKWEKKKREAEVF